MAIPQRYHELLLEAERRNKDWALACSNSECTLHQLSPYIGKLKSSIAKDLIEQYSKPGDIIIDPFSGSGTIPLEAAGLGRKIIASDASLYAYTLTRGKLFAPLTQDQAFARAEKMISAAERKPLPDLGNVPPWVQEFFHPQTLRETLRFSKVVKESGDSFIMACFLGILHHQRPGFLSYPSSHLVPYLRDKLFPRKEYPSLYEHREIRPRLLAKIKRAFKRPPQNEVPQMVILCKQQRIQDLTISAEYDCLITSPPYMNALDYGRDNRLRLWFLGEESSSNLDRRLNGRDDFLNAMSCVAKLIEQKLRKGGYAIFVVGEHDARGKNNFPSAEVASMLHAYAPSAKLEKIIADKIPDVRRSRRRLSGVKKEHIMVFRKVSRA